MQAALSLSRVEVDGLVSCNKDERSGVVRAADFTTRAVRAGIAADLEHGALVPPPFISRRRSRSSRSVNKRTYDYTRSGNPTRAHLAAIIAELEGGAGAVVTSSGMSAVALVLQALVKPGDVIVAAHDCYGGTHRILRAPGCSWSLRGRVRGLVRRGDLLAEPCTDPSTRVGGNAQQPVAPDH